MQTFYQILPYIIIGVAIVVFVSKLKKFKDMLPKNLASLSPSAVQASYENKMPKLAHLLGLKYSEANDDGSDKTTIMDTSSEMHGDYRNHKIEVVMGVKARHAGIVSTGTYSYSMKKYISLEVANPEKKSFHIQPKSKNIVSKDTGEQAFDEKLMVSGDIELPKEFLHYVGKFGWLNLKLEDNHLIFHDTFYEDLMQTDGVSSVMIARHPVWGTSPQNPELDIENAKAFIDKLIDLSEELKLN